MEASHVKNTPSHPFESSTLFNKQFLLKKPIQWYNTINESMLSLLEETMDYSKAVLRSSLGSGGKKNCGII